MSREQLEDELRRCNDIMVADGKTVGAMRACLKNLVERELIKDPTGDHYDEVLEAIAMPDAGEQVVVLHGSQVHDLVEVLGYLADEEQHYENQLEHNKEHGLELVTDHIWLTRERLRVAIDKQP